MRLPNKAGFWTFRAEYTGLERTRAVRDNGDYYAGLHVETAHFYGGTKWVPVGSDDEAGEWIEWHGDRAFNDETKKVEDKTMGARIKAGLRDATELKAANLLLDAVVDKCTEMVPQIEGVNRDVRRAGAALLLCHLYDHYGDSIPGVREYRDVLGGVIDHATTAVAFSVIDKLDIQKIVADVVGVVKGGVIEPSKADE